MFLNILNAHTKLIINSKWKNKKKKILNLNYVLSAYTEPRMILKYTFSDNIH